MWVFWALFVMYCTVWIVCNGVMQCNVCPVKRSGPGLVTEERGERRRRNGIRSLETVSWHHEHYPDTRHWAHEGEHISCVLMFWAVGLFLIMEVSLSLHHQVNRPDLIILILLLSSDQILILSWVVYPVTPGTADNVLLTLAADTLMQCGDKYLYFRQIFNVITRLFSGCVSISVCHHEPSHPGTEMIADCEEWDTPGSRGKKPSGSYLAFQQILTSLSQFVIQSPACWERRGGNYHQA